ncbi:MAG: YggT family protein [Fibrobacterota bacterium]
MSGLGAFFYVAYRVIDIFQWILIIRVILSWVRVDFGGRRTIDEFLYRATEWFLDPLRRMIPPMGMFDMSILAAFLVMEIIKAVLVSQISY